MEKRIKKTPKEKGKREAKKHADNIGAYLKKNEKRLMGERDGKVHITLAYDITPLQDFDDLKRKANILVMNNVYADTANYLSNMQFLVSLYFKESTAKLVDEKTLKRHVIPYDHSMFDTLFTMKIASIENYIIPLLLDFHYNRYRTSKEENNVKKNRSAFLNFLEFNVLHVLHTSSPFEYKEKGFGIVDWLREHRKKDKILWPLEDEEKKRTGSHKPHDVDVREILGLKMYGKFSLVEDHFHGRKFLRKDKGVWFWEKSKTDLIAMIYLLNKKGYFTKDILDESNMKLLKTVRTVFEKRYCFSFGQSFEPARIKTINHSKYLNLSPFKFI